VCSSDLGREREREFGKLFIRYIMTMKPIRVLLMQKWHVVMPSRVLFRYFISWYLYLKLT